ncbi:MAG: c-type cytochrome [Bacteroidales bacterium]
MKKLIKNLTALALVAIIFTAFSAMNMPQQEKPKPWPVPAEYKKMENPVKGDADAVKMGGMLYKRHCASCHGREGLGDGPKARGLKTFSGDFSGDFYQNQTDGEHFYKTLKGRDEMPGYENKVPEEDIWAMVSYMRTFKK